MNLSASMQEKVKGLLPDLLGIEFTDVTPEKTVARLTVRKDLCTIGDNLHGGAIMAFADTLGAVAAILNMPQGARTTTIESKTNFIGGAPLGSRGHGRIGAGAQGAHHGGLPDHHPQRGGQAGGPGHANPTRHCR